MPLPLVSAVSYVLVTCALGLLVGFVAEAWAGWALVAFGFGIQVVYHLRHFLLVEQWSRHPSPSVDLVGIGAWDEVLARLYRHERDLHREIEEARQHALMYAAAGQALIDGLISIDRNGRIEWCNDSAAGMLALNRRTDLGQPLANLVRHPDFIAFLSENDYARALRMRAGHNADRLLSLHIVPYGGNRRLLQIRDVTQTERIDAMRRDFVANVSHELRTPLTVLSGFVETIRDLESALEPEERARYFALMAEQSQRMQKILEELLELSNLESSPPPPATERIDMDALLDKLCRDARALSNGRHEICLIQSGNSDLLGSEIEMASAFSNLVSNAVRYTPERGKVTLEWRVHRDGAVFSVRDSGIGIDPKHIPRLTERFYRVDRSRSRETGGTGLGLAIVKHALSRHQAVLDIQSKIGEGSVFSARFPEVRLLRH